MIISNVTAIDGRIYYVNSRFELVVLKSVEGVKYTKTVVMGDVQDCAVSKHLLYCLRRSGTISILRRVTLKSLVHHKPQDGTKIHKMAASGAYFATVSEVKNPSPHPQDHPLSNPPNPHLFLTLKKPEDPHSPNSFPPSNPAISSLHTLRLPASIASPPSRMHISSISSSTHILTMMIDRPTTMIAYQIIDDRLCYVCMLSFDGGMMMLCRLCDVCE